jgi:NADPH-dependent 2,4-dienoyl-CoA reductase/sulfur reductase-like enzyme/rhodanese-related sulfurtransferase
MEQAKKTVVIGGVAGGASCAARLRRLDESAEIVMVERGPYISFANCGLPYHISGTIAKRSSLLVTTEEKFTSRFQTRVLSETEAVRILREKSAVILRDRKSGREWEESYDHLVLSPGGEPIRPPLPGIDLDGVFVMRSIPDLDRIMTFLTERAAKRATVIGGGFIGLEAAENLRERGLDVTIIEKAPQVMPIFDGEMAALLKQELSRHGIQTRLSVGIAGVEKSGDALLVQLDDRTSLETDIVILSIGVRPEVQLAKDAGLKLGPQGGIAVDTEMRTSDAKIFAVGDAVEAYSRVTETYQRVPLAGPANRQGRMVADAIAGRRVQYPGTLGTSIVKVFSLAAASVGLTEKQAKQNKVKHEVAWIHGRSHASYYPNAKPMTLKAVFSPDDGRILGAQVVGEDGVDKRIDVLATAVAAKMTVYDLEWLDLAYAPPFSSAKDPVNHLATVAANMLRGDHPTIRWDEIGRTNSQLVDVRTPEEYAKGTIPGAVNIPVDGLRNRLRELKKDQPIELFCAEGLRGYLAVRILNQNGFNARNMLGGIKLWQAALAQ